MNARYRATFRKHRQRCMKQADCLSWSAKPVKNLVPGSRAIRSARVWDMSRQQNADEPSSAMQLCLRLSFGKDRPGLAWAQLQPMLLRAPYVHTSALVVTRLLACSHASGSNNNSWPIWRAARWGVVFLAWWTALPCLSARVQGKTCRYRQGWVGESWRVLGEAILCCPPRRLAIGRPHRNVG
ncbi:uncharacterized protein B0I36DRAFT_71334 [Microdochium trichocladiopsis]|uniref:Uncharacterized protein n=1 Tax=Microdochium trichocladiopsis TaxID=1682393 RepID=A0A9P8YF21_9PEZI|nr:uncharacterized protein B0I36DRAFT_71334 [Microdochium trichocladiopsis]KAH7037806.1 hypothetical protein B0I36DRAFT_71334 [Microdochium trichocladiopsis]